MKRSRLRSGDIPVVSEAPPASAAAPTVGGAGGEAGPSAGKQAAPQPEQAPKQRWESINYATLGPKDILHALQAEEAALQKLHSTVRLQLQKLETEEAVLKQMIRVERRSLQQKGTRKAP